MLRGSLMMKQTPLLAILLAANPALAQAPPPVAPTPPLPVQQQAPTPAEIVLQINRVLSDWVQALSALQKQVPELQQQLQAVTRERDDLKAKCGEACAPPPPGEAKGRSLH